MIGLTSLFIRANGAITANPTAEEYHLDEIDDPVSFFQERLDSSLSHYDVSAPESTPINSRNNPSILSPTLNTGERYAQQSRIQSPGPLLAATT